MATAFLHLNGTDYELQHDIASVQDSTYSRLQRQVQRVLIAHGGASSGGHPDGGPGEPEHFDVRLNGCVVDLTVAVGSIQVAAVYLRSSGQVW